VPGVADRVAHVDAGAGVAGDMLLGALLDAGADLPAVRAAVGSLGVGADLELDRARRGGLACARLRVVLPDVADRERRLADVLALVRAAELAPAAGRFAARVFELLARAEGAVHDLPPEEVHFHEVGALDALVDVVGTAAAAASLGLLADRARVTCSALAAGSGTVRAAHGVLPVPAPAVLRLAADAGLALTGGDLTGERTTPTGAALVAALAVPGPLPSLRVEAVGVGGGGRDPDDRPNVTRVVVGHAEATDRPVDEVVVVEATVDDLDPRVWPSVLAAVRAAGAWDCWTTAVTGRHGRPGQVLSVLCAAEVREAVVDAVFRHTSTLGVRWSARQRATARRRSVPVEVGPPGSRQVVTVKVAEGTDEVPGPATPELADAEAAATALGWPVRVVCEAALVAYRTGPGLTSS
jgi:pyridinium-3,5-bisthiocarboxylic acid mononucleotide nickel chelatase